MENIKTDVNVNITKGDVKKTKIKNSAININTKCEHNEKVKVKLKVKENADGTITINSVSAEELHQMARSIMEVVTAENFPESDRLRNAYVINAVMELWL